MLQHANIIVIIQIMFHYIHVHTFRQFKPLNVLKIKWDLSNFYYEVLTSKFYVCANLLILNKLQISEKSKETNQGLARDVIILDLLNISPSLLLRSLGLYTWFFQPMVCSLGMILWLRNSSSLAQALLLLILKLRLAYFSFTTISTKLEFPTTFKSRYTGYAWGFS